MWADYKTKFGMEPKDDIEPTYDQLAGVKTAAEQGMLPGVNYSIFGPRGRRAVEKLTYSAQQ
jgi:hypothetical protein